MVINLSKVQLVVNITHIKVSQFKLTELVLNLKIRAVASLRTGTYEKSVNINIIPIHMVLRTGSALLIMYSTYAFK